MVVLEYNLSTENTERQWEEYLAKKAAVIDTARHANSILKIVSALADNNASLDPNAIRECSQALDAAIKSFDSFWRENE